MRIICGCFFAHQQVGQQDGHDDEEDDPENVGHYREGGQQVPVLIIVAKNAVILKLASGHHHGLNEGEAGITKGGDINHLGSIIQLQWIEEWPEHATGNKDSVCPRSNFVIRMFVWINSFA